MKSILLIDDSEDFRDSARIVLLAAGYDVWEAPSPDDAFPILAKEEFDLILCDLHMPFSTGERAEEYITSYEVGLRTVHELRDVFPATPIVALSSTPSDKLKRIAKYLDPVPAFPKPVHSDELLELVEEVLEAGGGEYIQ